MSLDFEGRRRVRAERNHQAREREAVLEREKAERVREYRLRHGFCLACGKTPRRCGCR